jgi:hypothetical protein
MTDLPKWRDELRDNWSDYIGLVFTGLAMLLLLVGSVIARQAWAAGSSIVTLVALFGWAFQLRRASWWKQEAYLEMRKRSRAAYRSIFPKDGPS